MTFMPRKSLGAVALFFSSSFSALLGAAAAGGCTAPEVSMAAPDAAPLDAGVAASDAARPPGKDPGADAAGPGASFTVGGTLEGLLGTGLVLANNGGDRIATLGDGPFTFPAPLANGAGYDVTVETRPTGPAQVCTVVKGRGTVAGTDVTDVSVKCSVASIGVGGTVAGLIGSGLVLQNEGGDDLPILKGGGFAFKTPLASGSPYAVTIKTQPTSPTQTCSVSGGTGTTGDNDVTTVVVNCGTNTYTVGGTVTGLVGSVVLQDEGGSDLALSANGTYAFPVPLASGKPYAVTVKTQPSGPTQLCTVVNASGSVTNTNVINVDIACTTSTFTVGGVIVGSGLGAPTLQNNGRDDLTVSASGGSFTFSTPVVSGGSYNVTLKGQSGGAYCYLTGNTRGVVTNANITNVIVTCPSSNTWTRVTPMPTPRELTAAALGKDGRIYVFGGSSGAGPLQTVEVYSPTLDSWTTAAPMYTARYFASAVTVPDGGIWVIGGDNGSNHLTNVEVYVPSTNEWLVAPALPTALAEPGAALGADGRLYAFGSNSTVQYDFSMQTWNGIARMRTPNVALRAASGNNSRIYVASGPSIDSFLPSGDTWGATSGTFAGGAGFIGFGYTGKLFLVGDAMTTYDIGTNATATALAPTAPHALGSGVVMPDGRIVAFGGVAGAVAHGIVEVYTP